LCRLCHAATCAISAFVSGIRWSALCQERTLISAICHIELVARMTCGFSLISYFIEQLALPQSAPLISSDAVCCGCRIERLAQGEV